MPLASRPRSPLWMVVLSLACEEPMHPYRMQTLIVQRGKDQVANVAQRNSVYQTIEALLRAGLIAVRGISRDEKRPERTVYEATELGRQTLLAWLRTVLSTPAREFPDFPAALSILDPRLKTGELRDLLESRVAALEARLPALEGPWPDVPRIFLLEEEYMAALVRAEIAWLRRTIEDLRSGRIKFPTEAELRRISKNMGGPSEEALRRMAEQASGSHTEGRPARAPRTKAKTRSGDGRSHSSTRRSGHSSSRSTRSPRRG